MRSGRLLVLAAMASFGALAFFAKVALRAGVAPLMFLVGRFSLASVLLVFTLSVTRPSRPARRDVWVALGLGALVYVGQAVALTYALTEGDASVVAVLFATYPALVVLGVATTRGLTAIGRRHLVALAGLLVGVALVIGPDTSATIHPLGVALALLSAACFAVFVVAADALGPRVDRTLLATYACVGAACTVTVIGAATGGLDTSGAVEGWFAIVGAGALSTAFAFLVLFAALSRTGPVTAGIVLGAEPVVTVLLGVTVLGDHVAVAQGIGFALVIGSVALLAAVTSRRPPVPTV